MTHVVVIDIGKTNAKLALVDGESLEEIAVVTRPNTVLAGPPWPHFDLEGHWDFMLEHLSAFQRQFGVDAISITTHGASCVLLDKDGALAAPMLDYEHPGPDELGDAYDALRPAFVETGSPRLAGGLNVGAQIAWMFAQDPGLKDRTAQVLTYPQYWAFRLTGVASTERTSLGCHTDLWMPAQDRPSRLSDHLGLADKLAPVRMAFDVMGPVKPDIAAQTGLAAETPVTCGIHDSNASLLPHLLGRVAPFTVVSSGTWIIAMAIGGASVELDPDRDTLVNVNARGEPVPSARFMGGREYDTLIQGARAHPTDADVDRVLATNLYMTPSVAGDTGPFRGRRAQWVPSGPAVGSAERDVAVAFYLALMTQTCLDLIGHRGAIIVEGPFARNGVYLSMLTAASGCDVVATSTATGTSQGAALLTDCAPPTLEVEPWPVPEARRAAMADYADAWRRVVADG